MTPVSPPRDGFVLKLTRLSYQGEPRWTDRTGKRLYTWDSLHGEFEVFNRRGAHLGAAKADGTMYKKAVKGRRIDV